MGEHMQPTSDSAASDVMEPWESHDALLSADVDTAGLSQPTSSALILNSEDQSMTVFGSFHGQLDMTHSVGSSHAARDPYFCAIINHNQSKKNV